MQNNFNGPDVPMDIVDAAAFINSREPVNYTREEAKLLDDIAASLHKLDDKAEKLDESNNSVTEFFNRQAAIREMRRIIRDGEKLERVDAHADAEAVNMAQHDIEKQENISAKIDGVFNKLEDTLKALESTDDSQHTKGFVEQKKALHEVGKILRDAGRYTAYREDEFSALENLS